MIRTAVLAALLLAAASPALAAYGHSSAPAPAPEGGHFAPVNYGLVSKLMPGTTSESLRFGDEQARPAGATVIYALPDGKPAAHIDVTDPRQNPFTAQPGSLIGRNPATPAPAR